MLLIYFYGKKSLCHLWRIYGRRPEKGTMVVPLFYCEEISNNFTFLLINYFIEKINAAKFFTI